MNVGANTYFAEVLPDAGEIDESQFESAACLSQILSNFPLTKRPDAKYTGLFRGVLFMQIEGVGCGPRVRDSLPFMEFLISLVDNIET